VGSIELHELWFGRIHFLCVSRLVTGNEHLPQQDLLNSIHTAAVPFLSADSEENRCVEPEYLLIGYLKFQM
jgi:hypothetical protein